jgi:hypothetical protein
MGSKITIPRDLLVDTQGNPLDPNTTILVNYLAFGDFDGYGMDMFQRWKEPDSGNGTYSTRLAYESDPWVVENNDGGAYNERPAGIKVLVVVAVLGEYTPTGETDIACAFWVTSEAM